MKLRTAVKKMVALGTGLAMLGATAFGALAADLSQYPSPLFVKDGQFDAFFVVGANAKTDDVLGAIEVATSLQTVAVKKKTIQTTTQVSVPTGVQIKRTGNQLTYGKYLNDVQNTALDETDLPSLLADGKYDDTEGETDNSVTYTQELFFPAGNGQLLFFQDDDDMPIAQPTLFLDKKVLYNYTLEFDEEVEYDNSTASNAQDDIEDTVLEILGNKYTITDVGTTTANKINKLTLLAGETVVWLAQGDVVTKTIAGVDHTVSLTDVNEDADKCGLSVDGTVAWIKKGETKTVNGVTIGVSDAIAVHKESGKDVCQVNIGATKIVLEDGKEVEVDDKDIDGSTVGLIGTPGKWGGFSVTFKPEEKEYLAKGEDLIDPIFKSFKINFEGLTDEKTETYKLTASGDDLTLTFLNNDGKEVKIQWTLDSSNKIILGTDDDIDERIYLEGQNATVTSDITELEGAKFYVVTSGGEAHVMEIRDFDTTNNKITIKDRTYDAEKTSDFDEGTLGAKTIDLPAGAGTAILSWLNSTGGTGTGTTGRVLNFTSTGSSRQAETLYNEEGITLGVIPTTGADPATLFYVKDETDDGVSAITFGVNATFDSSDKDININAPWAISGSFHASGVDFSSTNDDDKWYVTNWSTTILYDSENNDELTITYPDDYRFGQVFVAPVAAEVVTTAGGIETVELVPIQVGSAKLDTEITDPAAQNLIVVGGPCANSVAAKLLGNPADCTEGFTPGEAWIKLFEHTTGKVSLLVAGYSALDTRRATRVLANYKDYAANLKGSAVKVKGTTLTDITVSAA